jgi:hypothetical protein
MSSIKYILTSSDNNIKMKLEGKEIEIGIMVAHSKVMNQEKIEKAIMAKAKKNKVNYFVTLLSINENLPYDIQEETIYKKNKAKVIQNENEEYGTKIGYIKNGKIENSITIEVTRGSIGGIDFDSYKQNINGETIYYFEDKEVYIENPNKNEEKFLNENSKKEKKSTNNKKKSNKPNY